MFVRLITFISIPLHFVDTNARFQLARYTLRLVEHLQHYLVAILQREDWACLHQLSQYFFITEADSLVNNIFLSFSFITY